ncbi:MAG: TfoX/Sxy family protein [Rhodospirillaceae bacterium]|nr:TfoX/Sxy family protein [Rhodospirillaceae bacterium]
MAYDEEVAARLRRHLAGRDDVVEKRMMGGLCFMVGDAMCCGVSGAAVMIRVGRENYGAALAQPHVRPLEFGGRRPGGFVLVDPPGLATDAALAAWLKQGFDAAAAAAKAPSSRAGRPKRRRAVNRATDR